jgi:hypothetical protein
MSARRTLALTLLAFAGGAGAQDIEVISPRPDAVSVTIYRDLFALVTETRTVDLPADPVTLTFAGVVDTLIPQSAVVQQLDRKLDERNYDYDRLSPASLLRKSIGKTVTLTRTAPGSGKVTQLRAVILAANDDGITMRTEQGNEALHCSGLPESLTFDELPGDLHPEPKLSVRLAAGKPGKRTIRVSYLAQGFAWSSDYVAKLDSRGTRMDLTGWLTLRNFTNSRFRDAQVQVVAGRLNLLYDEDGGTSTIGATGDFPDEESLQQARESRYGEYAEENESEGLDLAMLSGCYPFGAPVVRTEREVVERSRLGGYPVYNGLGGGDFDEVVVTGMRRSVATLETLGDYQLYRLPWRTDLNARQTKQAVFLDKQDVKIDRFYSYRFEENQYNSDEPFVRPALMVSFENRKSSGLGEPLPAGNMRFFDSAPDGDVFAGEARMGDKPVGLPVELRYADAMDLTLHIDIDDDLEDVDDDDADVADLTFTVSNAKPLPAQIEIRQALDEDIANAKIVKSNHRVTRKFGDYAWRFTVPANSAGDLTYRLRVPDED